MKSLNRVQLLGNVGKDPEIKILPSGTSVANFSIATTESYKDHSGNWKDETAWHNITAYARIAEIARDYVHKGSKLYVEAKLQTRSWDDKQTGQKRYKVEIIAGNLILLGGKSDPQNNDLGDYSQYAQPRPNNEITDDDVPF